MINPEKLMLGNYILFKGKEIIVTPDIFRICSSTCKRKLFEGIEISEQKLIEFGLTYSNIFNTWQAPKMAFQKVSGKWFVMSDERHIFGEGFNFVHELQNNYFILNGEKLI